MYLFVAIKLPWVTDLLHDPDLVPECDRWAEQYNVTASQRSSIYNQEPYNEPIHQEVCKQLFDTYRDTMQSIAYYRSSIPFKIKNAMPALLPNKNTELAEQLIRNRQKRAVGVLLSQIASLGGPIIKGLNSYPNHKRNAAMSDAVKQLYTSDKLFHEWMLVM